VRDDININEEASISSIEATEAAKQRRRNENSNVSLAISLRRNIAAALSA